MMSSDALLLLDFQLYRMPGLWGRLLHGPDDLEGSCVDVRTRALLALSVLMKINDPML